MQPTQSVARKTDVSNRKQHSTAGIGKQLSSKEILQKLKNPKTSWRSISELLQLKDVNLVIPTAGIGAYGRQQLWQQALALFFELWQGSIRSQGLRLDAVAVSAAVSAVGSRWTLALWTLAGPMAVVGRLAPRGLTSAAVACGQHGEWPRALMLNQGAGSIQSLTASVSACEKPGRWSNALELCRQAMIYGRIEIDQVAVNGILNACVGARQWQRCVEVADKMTNNKDVVMSNILSNACAGPWAWPKALAALQDAQLEGGRSLLAGLSAAMQSLPQWPAAVECLKNLRKNTLQADAMACCSFLKTLELAGHWPQALQSLQQNDQKQIAPDAVLYNTLVSAGEKSSNWEATVSLLSLRSDHGGLDATSASATVLSCCQSARWPAALALLCLERSSVPPSSHALAAVLSVAENIPELEAAAFSMLAHATVDGVAPPVGMVHQLRWTLLGAAAYRHPGVTLPAIARHETSPSRQGLYRYSKELRLLRHVLHRAAGDGLTVCRAIESFGTQGGQRWLKVAGTQKAEVLEAVVAGIGGHAKHCEILEIGTYCGYSALRMLLSLKRPADLQIHSLEADPIHAAVACNVLQAAGVTQDEIKIHIGHSKSLLPKWPVAQFRAVFMDQRGSRYDEDLRLLEHRQLLAPGAAVMADNVLKPGAPRFLWKLWPRHERSSHEPSDCEYHVQVLSLEEFAMPSEDWMTVSIRRVPSTDAVLKVPEKIEELHHLAEAMRDLASKPGGSSVSFEEWRNFAEKMKEELKILGIEATCQLDCPGAS